MELTKQQQKTFNAFNEYNNVVVFAPRRSGKTQLIKHIIEQNKDKKIGIFTQSDYIFFRIGAYENCEHISSDASSFYKNKGKKFDIIIGEEDIVPRELNAGKKISFLTPQFVIDFWSLDDCKWFSLEELEKTRKALPKEILKSQFFID